MENFKLGITNITPWWLGSTGIVVIIDTKDRCFNMSQHYILKTSAFCSCNLVLYSSFMDFNLETCMNFLSYSVTVKNVAPVARWISNYLCLYTCFSFALVTYDQILHKLYFLCPFCACVVHLNCMEKDQVTNFILM